VEQEFPPLNSVLTVYSMTKKVVPNAETVTWPNHFFAIFPTFERYNKISGVLLLHFQYRPTLQALQALLRKFIKGRFQ
jgi:hypothetical protein